MIADTKAALAFKLSHDDLSKYNAVQRLLYAGIIVVAVMIVLSGLSIWKPVQLQGSPRCSAAMTLRATCIFSAWRRLSAFSSIHVLLALLVPKSLRAMVTGR